MPFPQEQEVNSIGCYHIKMAKMAKKRKNTPTEKKKCSSGTTAEQLPSTTTTTTTKRSSFESFPLYLVPNDNYSSSSSNNNNNNYDYDYDNDIGIGNSKSRELHEYVKGRVWVIPSFFSPIECQAWIDFCESFSDSDGSNKSSNDGDGFQYTAHPATNYIANRECYRMQETNGRELSDRIFKRLQGMTMTTKGVIHCGDGDASDGNNNNNNNNQKHNTSTSTSILSQIHQETADLYRNEYKPINCNPNLRVYRYNKGHAFGRHVDGSNVVTGYNGGGGNNDGSARSKRNTTCKTEMTMLLYLSTCEGGATRFHLPSSKRNRKNNANNNNNSIAYSPQVGSLLLHVHGNHCLEHEADVVLSGKKYVLRTDLIYGG
jgi:hypothetical protein